MPTVLNSKFVVSSGSFKLSRARDGLSKSQERLFSGKRLSSSTYDAECLAVKQVNANGFEDGIAGLLVDDMKKIVEARTESRVEPDRATDALGSPETNYPNVETAHGPMMNPDIAVKPTCFVGSNVLVPSSTAMSWQSMQLAKVSSTLLPKVINETHMHKIKPAGDSRTFCVHGHHAHPIPFRVLALNERRYVWKCESPNNLPSIDRDVVTN